MSKLEFEKMKKSIKRHIIWVHAIGFCIVLHLAWSILNTVYDSPWYIVFMAANFALLTWMAPDMPKLYKSLADLETLDYAGTCALCLDTVGNTKDLENGLCKKCNSHLSQQAHSYFNKGRENESEKL